jgi:outer membrane protein OmpA-like peptidoglycan-associated protein
LGKPLGVVDVFVSYQAAIKTEGLGAKKPVAPNTKPDGSPEGRQKNRRVELIVKK